MNKSIPQSWMQTPLKNYRGNKRLSNISWLPCLDFLRYFYVWLCPYFECSKHSGFSIVEFRFPSSASPVKIGSLQIPLLWNKFDENTGYPNRPQMSSAQTENCYFYITRIPSRVSSLVHLNGSENLWLSCIACCKFRYQNFLPKNQFFSL